MAVVLLWSTTALVQGQQKRFTVMGLGDSITEGGSKFSSYLYPLWEQLYSAGYDFDFIGPRQSECRIGKLNHCGFSGKNVEFLAARIDSIYSKYPADFVLLHAGHNHFSEENPVKYNPQNEMLAFCKTKCSIRKTKRILLRIPS